MIYRARSRFQPGTEKWDLILVAILLPAIVIEIPLATHDAGRMKWSDVPTLGGPDWLRPAYRRHRDHGLGSGRQSLL
jgi:hypothetical protein